MGRTVPLGATFAGVALLSWHEPEAVEVQLRANERARRPRPFLRRPPSRTRSSPSRRSTTGFLLRASTRWPLCCWQRPGKSALSFDERSADSSSEVSERESTVPGLSLLAAALSTERRRPYRASDAELLPARLLEPERDGSTVLPRTVHRAGSAEPNGLRVLLLPSSHLSDRGDPTQKPNRCWRESGLTCCGTRSPGPPLPLLNPLRHPCRTWTARMHGGGFPRLGQRPVERRPAACPVLLLCVDHVEGHPVRGHHRVGRSGKAEQETGFFLAVLRC